MSLVYTLYGDQTILKVFETEVIIEPRGLLSKKLFTETIPMNLLDDITLKPAGKLFGNGLLIISLKKDQKTHKPGTRGIRFTLHLQNDRAQKIVDFIESRIIELRKDRKFEVNEETIGITSKSVSLSDELQKLAELHNSGILTDEEFQAAKSKLINS